MRVATLRPKDPHLLIKPDEETAYIVLRNWLIVWVVLANAGFALMYFIGSPPRSAEIVLFGVAGLIVRDRAYIIQLIAFLILTAYSVLSFIAGLFNLSITSLRHSVVFLFELDVTRSIEYIVGSVLLCALTVAAAMMMRRSTSFRDTKSTFVAVAAVGFFAFVDLLVGQGMQGHYNRSATSTTQFTSAVSQAVTVPEGKPLERNLVIVVVESLGLPVHNAEMKGLLFNRFQAEDVVARFDVSQGTTSFFNSTTSGEIRELCGRWDEYFDLVDRFDPTCLPAQLAEQGVYTSAYHSFSGEFFERTKWYPNVGFENVLFRDDLIANGADSCGGVFPGACDRDIPRQIAEQLGRSDQPQFIYWLTVNSHLPVPLENNLEADDCERISIRIAKDFPMICRQFAIWDSIDRSLVHEITADDFPASDILIVGDHMPPYFDRYNRSQFAPDRVPWIFLKWRK